MVNREGKNRSKKSLKSQAQEEHVLDLRGMIIPLTLLKITHGFRQIRPGETLEIIGTDPDTRRDALKVLETPACEVLGIFDEEDTYLIRLRKRRDREA